MRNLKKQIHFTVDSALLRELGERLVGRPHIALAELVKNSYDADATMVEIRFAEDRIEVADNGHGMDFDEFENFWMRIGSPHKQNQRFSRELRRPLTGSKGVGRLAVQFLGRELELHTVGKNVSNVQIDGIVDWDSAVKQGELTAAYARYGEGKVNQKFPGQARNGTVLELSRLNQQWSAEDFEDLAKEIWWLQPPFRASAGRTSEQSAFEVVLEGPDPDYGERFDAQMQAYLGIWHARLVGEIESKPANGRAIWPLRTVSLSLEFADGTRQSREYGLEDCPLDRVSFEIRAFYLRGRQKYGIQVGTVREYFKRYGGVYVYDAGFRLPYYGPEHDWLNIEIDHSHRLSRSRLLPEELQVSEGMTYLPTNSRLFGVVHVDTSHERKQARDLREQLNTKEEQRRAVAEHLEIQVTRDRLTDNLAYRKLKDLVRWALDYYAMEEAKRQLGEVEARRSLEPPIVKFQKVEAVLDRYAEVIPRGAFVKLREQIQEAVKASETEAEIAVRRIALLAPLATAGIAALAYEHEATKLFASLESISNELTSLKGRRKGAEKELAGIAANLRDWLGRARATRALFSHMLDEENRETEKRFRARSVLDDVANQVAVFGRGTIIDTSAVEDRLRLPTARFTQWGALFQNVFLNSLNALLATKEKRIAVSSQASGRSRAIVIQDTGIGVELSSAAELFEPFVRHVQLPPERRALGLGGGGLGLTIVRMIAEEVGCTVEFIKPELGFNTAFRLSWKEQ